MKTIVAQGYSNKRFAGSVNSHTVNLKGVNLTMHIDDTSLEEWNRQIYGMIEAAGENGHKLVDSAVHAILNNSYMYVPIDTSTLAESGYARTVSAIGTKLSRVGSDSKRETIFTGVVGYGDDRASGTINPKNGMRPSQYAWQVHEDLSIEHKVGQAKFLERAYREYIADQWQSELVNLEKTIYTGKGRTPLFEYTKNAKMFKGFGKATVKQRSKDTKSNVERILDTRK